jgi:hypothetical protein
VSVNVDGYLCHSLYKISERAGERKHHPRAKERGHDDRHDPMDVAERRETEEEDSEGTKHCAEFASYEAGFGGSGPAVLLDLEAVFAGGISAANRAKQWYQRYTGGTGDTGDKGTQELMTRNVNEGT